MRSRGGPSPARSAGVADKAHHLGPRRRRGRDPATACRARGLAGGSEFTGHGVVRRAGNPGHPHLRPLAPPREERPGHHRDPRSNHVVRRYASLPPPRTPTPSTGCRAARGSRPDTRVNYPGPHPQAHRGGRRQGGQAQAPAVRPRTPPGRLAGHRRPDRRPEGRIDRLPQPTTPPSSPAAPASSRTSSPAWPRTRPTSTRPARTPSIPPDVRKGIRVRRASPAAPDYAGSST